MNPEGNPNEAQYSDVDSHWHGMQRLGELEQRSRGGEGWRLVDAYLSGGAPWGFTLSGGMEYQEPLLITKVEEGSRAASVSLQVGDELVSINDIPLTGYRQEAICLVKGSYKALSLVVKRNIKMVDIVAQKMPSENDVHVARSFLTKILRSSMRRNEPVSRPHSWHSTKFNENQSEAAKAQSPPWQTRYDPSSSSTDLSASWDQTNLRRVSDQFSSLGSMDSLEHPYPAGQLSPTKSNNSMEHLAGGKRDSAYSSFSTSSGTPDYTLSKSNAASTENMLYKVSQWDAGGKDRNGRNPIEGVKQNDRVTYFQIPGAGTGREGPQSEEAAVSRHSTSSRTTFGPVWHVPDKKKTASPSPPPPPPPARSDSFAATKVHERGLAAGHHEGPDSHVPSKASAENRRSYNLPLRNESDHFYDKPKYNQCTSNKQSSLSNSDAHPGQPCHKRHHSDKSTFIPQPWTTSGPKPQSVGGYYSSMQELSTNGYAQFAQNHRRNLSTSMSTIATEHVAESGGHNRYYRVTTCQPSQPNSQPEQENGTNVDLARTGGVGTPVSPQAAPKATYHPPLSKDSNGYNKHQEASVLKPNADERGGQRGHVEAQYSRQSDQRRSLSLQSRESSQDVRRQSQVGNKISPQATPMLHSLSADVAGQGERTDFLEESVESKQLRRSDRFATTLRNEIQMRRANLQKSKSAEGETEDVTNSYKDHVKEAQKRVLKATSFRRKDLEPVLLENPSPDSLPGYPSVAVARKDAPQLPTVTESVGKSGLAAGQVTRIGGRKRFNAEEKVRSFSEPDKIHEVGVKEDRPRQENASSLLDRGTRQNPGVLGHIHSCTDIQARDCVLPGARADAQKGTGRREAAEEAQALPCPPHKFVPDQQRLGTFAEYEAKWNVQKKPPETRASGRYGSADNILDPRTDESKTACFHARSKSSPSAEVYGQKIPGRSDTEHSQPESKPAQRLPAAVGFSDCKAGDEPAESYSVPAPPSVTGTDPSCRRTLASAGHSSELSVPETPPPPENLDGRQSEGLGRRCPDGAAAAPPRSPKADSERGNGAAGHLSTPSPRRDPSPPASSYRPSAPAGMEGQRSPSPQFSPQRLSDKPPVSLQDEDTSRMEHVLENTNAVKKVPIRIVHSEGVAEKETCPFLQQSSFVAFEAEGPDVNRIGRVGATGENSVFCAFTRQKEPDRVPAPPSDTRTAPAAAGHRVHPGCQQAASTAALNKDDVKREELARDIMGKDKSLAEILDQSKVKTTMDLMEGIFPQEEQLLEGAHQRRKVPSKQTASRPAEERESEDNMAAAVTMMTSSTYYSTSAPKAELLNKMKDMPEEEDDSEDELDIDLANKKQELIDSLTKKLRVLRDARESLQEDVLDNNSLGDEVEARVQQVCKPNELDKFKMFVGDLDKVVSLLLSLSGRLARVENALNSLEGDATPEERRTLMEKRKLLIRQHEDAKELKENLDRRERVVYDILANYLPDDSLTDYRHFVKMKSALIIEQRKLEDKIKLGEEQLKCLMDSLPLEQRLAF